jgi:hypothetical protein
LLFFIQQRPSVIGSCRSLSPPGKGHADPIGLKRGEAVRPTGGNPIETAAFCHLKP